MEEVATRLDFFEAEAGRGNTYERITPPLIHVCKLTLTSLWSLRVVNHEIPFTLLVVLLFLIAQVVII